MKHLKFYVIALLSLIATPGLLQAQAMSPGKVQAFIVQGDVQLVAKDGTASPLARGQQFEEGSVVKAGPNGMALLVFSNGATMKVLQSCQLSIDKFQQASFDEGAEGTFLRLSKDPSKSTTTLDLRNGTLQGEVKQLNQAAGSTFTVNTPAGSAGIRGTIVSISVVRNAAGQIVGITCNCVTGAVAFTPSTSVGAGTGAGTTTTANNTNVSNVSVGTGASLVVQLTVDPTTGQITGGAISGSAMATATNQALADALVETINTAKTQAGLAAQPPPVINVTQAPVATDSNGTSAPVTQNTAVTLSPTATTQASGTATYSSSPTVTVNSNNPTTGSSTTTNVNTNPSTVNPQPMSPPANL
jgi:hypothetical protein